MNREAKKYWDSYRGNQMIHPSVSAWQFGVEPDMLAQLVVDGHKTATCSAHIFYEIEKEPLPVVGEYNIILNRQDQPVAITKTTEVTVIPMNEVSEAFAIAEGEGDRTYQYWWNEHEKFFTKELEEIGLVFSEDMLLVCERFEVVDIKNK